MGMYPNPSNCARPPNAPTELVNCVAFVNAFVAFVEASVAAALTVNSDARVELICAFRPLISFTALLTLDINVVLVTGRL